eukprot:gene6815-4895_t
MAWRGPTHQCNTYPNSGWTREQPCPYGVRSYAQERERHSRSRGLKVQGLEKEMFDRSTGVEGGGEREGESSSLSSASIAPILPLIRSPTTKNNNNIRKGIGPLSVHHTNNYSRLWHVQHFDPHLVSPISRSVDERTVKVLAPALKPSACYLSLSLFLSDSLHAGVHPNYPISHHTGTEQEQEQERERIGRSRKEKKGTIPYTVWALPSPVARRCVVLYSGRGSLAVLLVIFVFCLFVCFFGLRLWRVSRHPVALNPWRASEAGWSSAVACCLALNVLLFLGIIQASLSVEEVESLVGYRFPFYPLIFSIFFDEKKKIREEKNNNEERVITYSSFEFYHAKQLFIYLFSLIFRRPFRMRSDPSGDRSPSPPPGTPAPHRPPPPPPQQQQQQGPGPSFIPHPPHAAYAPDHRPLPQQHAQPALTLPSGPIPLYAAAASYVYAFRPPPPPAPTAFTPAVLYTASPPLQQPQAYIAMQQQLSPTGLHAVVYPPPQHIVAPDPPAQRPPARPAAGASPARPPSDPAPGPGPHVFSSGPRDSGEAAAAAAEVGLMLATRALEEDELDSTPAPPRLLPPPPSRPALPPPRHTDVEWRGTASHSSRPARPRSRSGQRAPPSPARCFPLKSAAKAASPPSALRPAAPLSVTPARQTTPFLPMARSPPPLPLSSTVEPADASTSSISQHSVQDAGEGPTPEQLAAFTARARALQERLERVYIRVRCLNSPFEAPTLVADPPIPPQRAPGRPASRDVVVGEAREEEDDVVGGGAATDWPAVLSESMLDIDENELREEEVERHTVMRCSIHLPRFRELMLRLVPAELFTTVIRSQRTRCPKKAISWKFFIIHHLHLHLFTYRQADFAAFPGLACHISPADFRCTSWKPTEIIEEDNKIGLLLWSTYFRWDFLLPRCLQILGESIQERSARYGVAPFVRDIAAATVPGVPLHPSDMVMASLLGRQILPLGRDAPGGAPQLHFTHDDDDGIGPEGMGGIDTHRHPLLGDPRPGRGDADLVDMEALLDRVTADDEGAERTGGATQGPKPTSVAAEEDRRVNPDNVRLKLFHIVKELRVNLLQATPILALLPTDRLMLAVQGILSHISLNPVTDGRPEDCPQHPQSRSKHRTAKWNSVLQCWVVGGGCYCRCRSLTKAMAMDGNRDFMFFRVAELVNLQSWWRAYVERRLPEAKRNETEEAKERELLAEPVTSDDHPDREVMKRGRKKKLKHPGRRPLRQESQKQGGGQERLFTVIISLPPLIIIIIIIILVVVYFKDADGRCAFLLVFGVG